MKTKRERYLNLLISKKHNELIIVITGMRKCEKSYFLFIIFKRIIITKGILMPHYNENGVLIMSECDFLLNENSFDI